MINHIKKTIAEEKKVSKGKLEDQRMKHHISPVKTKNFQSAKERQYSMKQAILQK